MQYNACMNVGGSKVEGGGEFEGFWRDLEAAVVAFRSSVDSGPVIPAANAADLRALLADRFAFDRPLGHSELIGEVARILAEFNLHTPHRRYFGLYNPDVIPITVAADALAQGHLGRDARAEDVAAAR